MTWGDTPYRNVPTLEALLELIKDGYRMSRPQHCPWRLWSIIKTCWMYQPEARPTWSHLISSVLELYQDTLPGEYLELANHSLPTPPSSTENTGDQFRPAVKERSHYKVLSSSVSGEYYRTLTSSPPTPAYRLLSTTDSPSPHKHLLTNPSLQDTRYEGGLLNCKMKHYLIYSHSRVYLVSSCISKQISL